MLSTTTPHFSSDDDSDDTPVSYKYCTVCTGAIQSQSTTITLDSASGNYQLYCDDCLESGYHKKNDDVKPLEIRTTPHDRDPDNATDTRLPTPLVTLWNAIVQCFRRVFSCFF